MYTYNLINLEGRDLEGTESENLTEPGILQSCSQHLAPSSIADPCTRWVNLLPPQSFKFLASNINIQLAVMAKLNKFNVRGEGNAYSRID
jgi:hypothetical protein